MAGISKFTVRTSGRRTMRRCLRKWGFQSSTRMNLQRKGTEQNINFWFGSAIHFALEDWFGYNRFGDPQRAFQAYYAAFPAYDRPEGADLHYFLGLGMLDYFRPWYVKHNETYGFQTVWLNQDGSEAEPGFPGARPLVEESFILDLSVKAWTREDNAEIVDVKNTEVDGAGRRYVLVKGAGEPVWEVAGQTSDYGKVYVKEVPIYYHGTLDRVVKDRLGRWWIMDWKTAKGADTNKLDTDDQITAYLWAAEQWFGRPIHGFMYVQLTKDLARPPKTLANGDISVDKKQKTTYGLAKQKVIDKYGEVRKAPAKVIEYLNNLIAEELPEGDRFVRWDAVTRVQAEKVSTYHHIIAETKMQIDPNLYLFPNFTRDCIWDCPFRDACLMMERGQLDVMQQWLDQYFEQRPREEDGNIDNWRDSIPWPDTPQGQAIDTMLADLEMSASATLDIILPDKYRDLDE